MCTAVLIVAEGSDGCFAPNMSMELLRDSSLHMCQVRQWMALAIHGMVGSVFRTS